MKELCMIIKAEKAIARARASFAFTTGKLIDLRLYIGYDDTAGG